ncbi:NitT/TauT family transport system permease protein [Stella humosa]|uniref:NitT/TauT family transport system permease protein n=1 Tax=Stella humosa TaxID=94 RepID=A0A3N1MB55_9PROT|nr:ABC transporter permease [Stella humosa]ROP99999.1 NitT/TauT family transport system permease protein [Stella humosa]BBK30769.1 ABC transporter permease [Stella humosa]
MSATDRLDRVRPREQAAIGRRGLSGRGWGFVLPTASGIGGLLLWELAVHAFELPSYLLPAPSEVAMVMVQKWRLLLDQLVYTAFAATVGFVIALGIALGLGAMIAASPFVERVIYVWLVVFHAIPKVVVAPLLLVWIGFGLKSSIIFVVVFTFFPMLVNTVAGLRSADPDLLLLARSMGGSAWQVLRKIRIPAAMPSIISGIKISITLAPLGAVIGEFVASNKGLGHMLIQSVGSLEVPVAFAAVTVVSVLGILVWYLAEFVERATIPWHASQRGRASEES